MAEKDVSPLVVARGDLGRMRELAGCLAEAIASELVRRDPRSRHG
jgi:hypothetical protein